MAHFTLIALDLAKTTFQFGKFKGNTEIQNQAMSRSKLKEVLAKTKPCKVVMEACATSHYWARFCRACGHEVMVLDPRFVKGFRVGHKTDANDVRAIATASQSLNAKSSRILDVEQQALQSIDKMRTLAERQKRQLGNQIRGLLLEFGFVIPQSEAKFNSLVPEYLADESRELPESFKTALKIHYEMYQHVENHLDSLSKQVKSLAKQNESCKRLMALEGVGPITAIGLWLHLADHQQYPNARIASACAGVTPQQHSSGNATRIGHVRKGGKSMPLRSNLFLGARAAVSALKARPAKTAKEQWIKRLVERRGVNCASMALANKTVRTAYAMMKHGTEYQVELLPETI